MPPNLDVLRAEIDADPLALGYTAPRAAGSDHALADLLNALRAAFSCRAPVVPIWRVLAWAAEEGRYERVYTAAASGPAGVRSVAGCALKILDALADVNLDAPELRTLLAALVTAAVLSAADRDCLLALGDRSPASRAEVLFGPGTVVTASDIARALRGAS